MSACVRHFLVKFRDLQFPNMKSDNLSQKTKVEANAMRFLGGLVEE